MSGAKRSRRLSSAGRHGNAVRVSQPTTREAFTVAPDVVYSPIVSLVEFVTNRSDPDTAMPAGLGQLRDKGGIDLQTDVVYSPTVPVEELATNRSDPDTAMPVGSESP